jgi:transposase
VYREGRNWTQRHWTWIRSQHFTLPTLERTLAEYRCAVEQLLARVADLTREIAALAETAPYREPVGGLRCFRGIDTLAAMTLLAELGDVQRFDHPRQLMAYLGLVPSEHSSGDRTQRGSITKAGNLHVRRILVEACWHYRHPPRLGPPWPAGVRASPRPSSPRRGGRSFGSIGGIGISSGTGSGPRSRWWRAPASWPASSGPH